jgi:hypothetical protein
MAIELSNLTFTDEDDIVPASGVEQIVNTSIIVNTLAGNDIITGRGSRFSFLNYGVLNTSDGDDILIGSRNLNEDPDLGGAGFYTYGGDFTTDFFSGTKRYGGIIDTGNGNDIITGIAKRGAGIVVTSLGTITTGNGNDTITGTATNTGIRLDNGDTVDTGNGNDIITGTGFFGFENSSTFNTGDGNDIITGTDTTEGGYGIYNHIETFVSQYSTNNITIDTGDGDDTITGIGGIGIYNDGTIHTDDGNDLITGTSGDLYGGTSLANGGVINTGDGNDKITGTATGTGMSDVGFLNAGTTDTGNGNDIITGIGS